MTNWKSHTVCSFDCCQNQRLWMTLKGHCALCFSKHVRLSQPTTKIRLKIDPYCQRRRCSPITLDSGNIRFMWIFAGVPWKATEFSNVRTPVSQFSVGCANVNRICLSKSNTGLPLAALVDDGQWITNLIFAIYVVSISLFCRYRHFVNFYIREKYDAYGVVHYLFTVVNYYNWANCCNRDNYTNYVSFYSTEKYDRYGVVPYSFAVSQCSTVVRNTVVRAVQKCIGKPRFWTPVAP